jgi:hypothetical protein
LETDKIEENPYDIVKPRPETLHFTPLHAQVNSASSSPVTFVPTLIGAPSCISARMHAGQFELEIDGRLFARGQQWDFELEIGRI